MLQIILLRIQICAVSNSNSNIFRVHHERDRWSGNGSAINRTAGNIPLISVDMNSSLYRVLILAASLREKGKGRADERIPRRYERTERLPHSTDALVASDWALQDVDV